MSGMPTFNLPASITPAVLAYLVVSGLLLVWNIVYAGRVARLRRAPRPLAALSAAGGLLVAPALLAEVANRTLLGGRAVSAIGWLWLVTIAIFVAQAAYATLRRLVTPFLGVPLLIYDTLLLLTTATEYATRVTGSAPAPLLALLAAQRSVLGVALGRAALISPLAVQLPIIVPAYPARFRLTRTGRALLAVAASFGAGALLLELPHGFGAIRSYEAWASDRLSERPAGDFVIGVKILPTLNGPPPVAAVRHALPIADSVDLGAVAVTLRPGALRLAAVDSLARLLEPLRRDTTRLVVSLGFDDGDGEALRADPAAFEQRRLALVERAARALRPDVLLPAAAPYGPDAAPLGPVPLAFWTQYYAAAVERAHAINPRIRVGVAASSYDAADSALYAWAASADSPVEAVGFTVRPSFSGGAGVDARLRAADRWMQAAAARGGAPRRPKQHWLFDVRGFPAAHGDMSQERTVGHALSWATGRAEFVGVIVAEPSDYLSATGLRTSTGRMRTTVAAMRRATRGLREAVAP